MEHPVRRNHLPFSSFALSPCPGPPGSPRSPLCSRTGRKCPQMSLQLPAIPPRCRSGNYQRTSLTTAWGIRLNPVNVFILKKRCTFNRKPWGLVFFFLFCLHFFCKKVKKRIKKKKKQTLHPGKWKEVFPCVCARSCACVCCQPSVDSLLVRDRRPALTLRPAAGRSPARGEQGLCPQPPGAGGSREAPGGEGSTRHPARGEEDAKGRPAPRGWDGTGGAAAWL